MQANWSLILNVLLLVGVIIAIGRIMKARRQSAFVEHPQPSFGQLIAEQEDDIIAVRKLSRENPPLFEEEPLIPSSEEANNASEDENEASVMMFLLAKENRQLAGYELLQTVLAAGLRFGDGHLFHRHQHTNGQGPVMCSLAAATPTGMFDLQNIGAFSVHGLCLFMQASGNSTIDAERFSIMLETGKQLSEGLDAYLLDEHRLPLSEMSLQNYYHRLKLGDEAGQLSLA